MPIRPPAGADVRQLLAALGGDDAVARDAAVARLAVIGPRAVEQLLREYPSAGPRLRAGILRACEASPDPRMLPIARDALNGDAMVTTAAVGLLRALMAAPSLPADVAGAALDGLVSAAVDVKRPASVRVAALDALKDAPADVRVPVRAKLAADADPEVRARAAAPPSPGSGSADEIWAAAIAGRLPASPDLLKRALAARRSKARLTELQHLVDHVRQRERGETDRLRREEWRAARGAVHQALAARNSRLALYDLRDSLREPERLPVAFLAALEEIGDATCLEPLAAAYDASSRSGDAWWREHVATAFRAIVQREGLTRRHAAVKRTLARWPEAAADLMARM